MTAQNLGEDDEKALPFKNFDSKEDLKISLENRVVHVEGKKEILGNSYEIDKKFVLPNESFNSEEPITAKIENGLLFINLNKNKKEKKKEIEIL